MVFVAGQAYVLEHADPANRARSFSLFVGAIMVASICGPSIGGILADNIGNRATFLVAALLAAGSLAAIGLLPDTTRRAGERAVPARMPRLAEIGALLTNRHFMTVTGLAAMPAKILLTGVCFYLVPMYVIAIDSTQAMAGRILMTYAVLMVVAAPFTATLATTRERMEWLVGGGLVVSGLGGVVLLAGHAVGWVFFGVALVGLGQALSISAQSALVAEHCKHEIEKMGEGAVYGVYRLLERLGNAMGPLIAAGLTVTFSDHTAFVVIGAFVSFCGLAFVLVTRRVPQPVPAVA
jgi:MFS family permease